MHAQASLASTARASQGQKPYILAVQELPDGSYFLLPTNEGSRHDGQVARVATTSAGHPERWKVGRHACDHQLEDVAGIAYILEAMLSKVAQADTFWQIVLDEIAGRL